MISSMKEKPIIHLLIRNISARAVVDEWIEKSSEADLRIRKAKTPGCVVIETVDPIYARRIAEMYGCKINIIE